MQLDNIFREYDIRGIVDQELNENSVKAIGYALGLKMKEMGVKTLSIGYDARLSADNLFLYLLSGLNCAGGIKIYNIGLAPTPVGYFSVYADFFDANIMITGSHNPKEYNGFKITIFKESFFGKDLQILKNKVLEIINNNTEIKNNSECVNFDILTPYIDFFVKEFSHLKNFSTPFVADCGNGAIGITLKPIIKALGLNAEILYQEPNGNFPNHHPDPSEDKNLKDIINFIKNKDCNIGFGFDGDGDRIAVITPKHNIKGDDLAYLYTLNMKNPKVLGEVKCSQNMYDEIAKIGKVFMGKTGHSNIKKMMKELDVDLAAEVSGHIFFKERYFGFDDALYAMMRIIELLKLGFDLDKELEKLPTLFSTDELKLYVNEDSKFDIVENFKNTIKNKKTDLPNIENMIEIDGIRVKFKDGWALVRASNTTPVIVTRFEATNKDFLKEIQTKTTELLKSLVK